MEIPKPLEPVIKLLVKNYTADLNLPYIKNPIAHSLYMTWKHFDAKKGISIPMTDIFGVDLDGYVCSVCHNYMSSNDLKSCPFCGVEMRDESK